MSSADFRLGELLVSFGLASASQVDSGLRFSDYTSLPLGKAMLIQRSVPETLLRGAIDAQWMIREQLLDLDNAYKAIQVMRRKPWSFPDALVSMAIDAHATRGGRIGELLSDSDLVSKEDLEKSLIASKRTGFALGAVLISENKISQLKLQLSLALQRELRSGKIDRPVVIQRLRMKVCPDDTLTLPSTKLRSINSKCV